MKIAITVKDKNPGSQIDLRFGRCAFFAIYTDEDKQWRFLPNPGAGEGTGAGVKAAQFILEEGVDLLFTGELGPNAMQTIEAAGIKVYSLPEIPATEALERYIRGELESMGNGEKNKVSRATADEGMREKAAGARERVAIATEGASVAQHFGRCPSYTLVDIENGKVVGKNVIANPGHEPGFLPRFLGERGVHCIIAGGMGPRAQGLFAEQSIRTVIGVTGLVEEVIENYLSGSLEAGESFCEHGSGGHECHH
ncbi:MAG: NifB/NifX family molybdenum-iron cluster-binding protein [Dethiobacteria bacterium]